MHCKLAPINFMQLTCQCTSANASQNFGNSFYGFLVDWKHTMEQKGTNDKARVKSFTLSSSKNPFMSKQSFQDCDKGMHRKADIIKTV